MSSKELLHPVAHRWFTDCVGEPSEPQRQGWPLIAAGRHTLIAAPTGSGKTLSAFMICIDRLLRQAIAGTLEQSVQVIYVSPLKALSNDIRRNLQEPLAAVIEQAKASGLSCQNIDVLVRTGDTPSSERQRMLRHPPHILVTTPESLYLLLTGSKSREILRSANTVILDEIHALARDKRGSHLMLSVERLEELTGRPLQRIGLSATQRPLDRMAEFLVGSRRDAKGQPDCSIVDVGHQREFDINIEVPKTELGAICSHEQWDDLYERLVELIQQHRSTLVFVNTRRLAERVSHKLTEIMGEDAVASHHGSMSKEHRLRAEERLKGGELKAVVATASLELGIDIGAVDLVVQVGSPRAIATFLQRIGRSGHALGLIPKGRFLALTRDELVECVALMDAIENGELDEFPPPVAPLDILAQQIVATVAAESVSEASLLKMIRRAAPYQQLEKKDFDAVLQMLAEGVGSGQKHGAHLHRDRINKTLKARRGAKLTAVTSGGAIPDLAEYRVVTDDGVMVGALDEEFAIESAKGDVFLLGNSSWRILYVRGGQVVVADAQGAPPSVPFWNGEAPGRTFELSSAVSRVREQIADLVPDLDDEQQPSDEEWHRWTAKAETYLQKRYGVSSWIARQVARYIAAQKLAMGLVPTQKKVIFERFFDETGGMQMVIHAPFGTRVNRAWGLAMRKRYCRRFDFELQAQADDNGFVLAMGPQDGFPLDSMFKLVQSKDARTIVEQAILQTPLFPTRWRWNVTRSLTVRRFSGGKKVPPHLQRYRAEDLLAAVFPAQTQCFEHKTGDTELPDHPLVQQTMHDCLTEPMDFERWLKVIEDIEAGRIELIAKDVREPSPFSHQLIHASPYAFLDDAPLEERRARALSTRRGLSLEALHDLGALDSGAIATVRQQAWPTVRDCDELHDALLQMVVLRADECGGWQHWFDELVIMGRAFLLNLGSEKEFWVAAERVAVVEDIYRCGDHWRSEPKLDSELMVRLGREEAWKLLLRGRMAAMGPVTVSELANRLHLNADHVESFLRVLESEGAVLAGHYSNADSAEFCDRRLLARIHHLTLDGLRQRIRPVDQQTYYRFLCQRHHAGAAHRLEGRSGLENILTKLQGFPAAAGVWEEEILPLRLMDYHGHVLDELTLSGQFAWQKHVVDIQQATQKRGQFSKASPIAFFPRTSWAETFGKQIARDSEQLSVHAQTLWESFADGGAYFQDQLGKRSGLLPSQITDALKELVAAGLIRADGFAGVRQFFAKPQQGRTKRFAALAKAGQAASAPGRWSSVRTEQEPATDEEVVIHWCAVLLDRYGVVCRDLLAREPLAPSWVSLAMHYRRLEARGEIRGGRFVTGLAGEQYAQPEVVDQLRDLREKPDAAEPIVISANDPLNLAGILTEGLKVPAHRRNRLVIQSGRVIATRIGDEYDFTDEKDPTKRDLLVRAMRLKGQVRYRDPFWQQATPTKQALQKPKSWGRLSLREQMQAWPQLKKDSPSE